LNFDDLRRYASRRFLRVFPVYIATVCVAFAFIAPTQAKFSFSYFIGEAFMLRSVGSAAFVNPTAWSLYVEILFYLVAPMFVIIASSRPVLWAIGAFLVLSIGDAIGPRELALWKFFACGIVAAEIIRRWTPSARTATAAALVGLCVILYDMHVQNDWILNLLGGGRLTFSAAQPAYTFSLCVGVVLLLTGSVKSPLFRSVLEAAPLRMLGAISYSLFMWHSFLIAANFPISFVGTGGVATTGEMPHVHGAAMILIVIPALIAVAAISYVAIERPFLMFRRGGRAATVIPVADSIPSPDPEQPSPAMS
jgi:peptidoglycan/LPS O-acetylase OafA/YrhL